MKKKSILRNIIITLLALVAAGVISFIFQRLEVQEHITTIFVFSVFIVSLFTDGYFYGIFSSVVGTVAINFVFTYPFLKFDFITPVNVISAIIMLAIAVITGMLTTKIKTYEEAKAESEREKTRANLLRAVSHDLRTPLTSIYSASSLLRDEKETLTEEQKEKTFGPIKPVYKTEYEGELIEHPIETFFESALYSLGKNTLSVAYNINGATKYKFIPILESFEIRDNFATKKRTKRMYKVNLSNELKNMMFSGYNLIDLKDYRSLPNKRAYRKFYLNLSKMIFLIKHKIRVGQDPEFIMSVDELARHFDINIANNHDRKKKVTATLNAINKNLTQTKFEYEYIKKENEKWAYSIRFRFSEDTLKYFDEKAKAIITAQYYESLKDAYLKKKGVQVYDAYKYKDAFQFGSGNLNDEFTDWAYSDEDKELKKQIFRNIYQKIMKMQPKYDYTINMADIKPL